MKSNLQEWLHYLEQMQPDKIELGLKRIKKVAVSANLDKPPFRIITVAGTNGKGSTVAYCDAILVNHGYRCGVYTSPHFVEFNERIVVDGERVADDLLCEAFQAVDNARDEVALTYFEFTTLAAIHCYIALQVDVAILEVGLGGRLDAVNAWDPDVACITSIGVDHTDWLGDDREQIGREKAGVARHGKVLVCGDTNPPASIAEAAETIGATLCQRDQQFHIEYVNDDQWRYIDDHQNLLLPRPRIKGSWACDNASVAICTVGHFLGEAASPQSVESALKQVTMTGRMQILESHGTEVILDVAHNAAAAEKLAQYLASHPISGVTRGVFACMQDKDVAAIVEALGAGIDQWCIAELDYPRAMQADEIQTEVLGQRQVKTDIFASVIQASQAAVAQSDPRDRVVVFGSFHVVGPALSIFS